MLRCDDFTELVTDYLEGKMPLADTAEAYIHLRKCRACRTYLRQMKATVKLLRELPAPSPPTEVTDALLASFRRAHCVSILVSSAQAAQLAAAD
jgi:anti-sigma factor RsiW